MRVSSPLLSIPLLLLTHGSSTCTLALLASPSSSTSCSRQFPVISNNSNDNKHKPTAFVKKVSFCRGGSIASASTKSSATSTSLEASFDKEIESESESESVSEEYSDTDSEEEEEEIPIVTNSMFQTNDNVDNADNDNDNDNDLELGSSYKMVSLLWISLALDVLINPTKRVRLFGSEYPRIHLAFGQPSFNAFASLVLASGFVVAAGMALICSLDLSMLDKNNNDGDKKKKKENVQAFVLRKSSGYLVLFGIMNLMAQAIPNALYLGMSAAVINVHNVLAGFNEARKSKMNNDENNTLWSCLKQTCSITPLISLGYLLPMMVVLYQIIYTSLDLIPLLAAPSLLVTFASTATQTTSALELASLRALKVASLARYILGFGLLNLLKQGVSKSYLLKTGTYRALNGIASMGSVMAAMAYLSSILGGFGSMVTNKIMCGCYFTFSAFAALQCVRPFGYNNKKQ